MSVAMNDLARVFIFPRGVNACNVKPIYGDCFAVDGLTQDGGDITRIECPDPFQYGKFKEVAAVRGERGRLTTTMTRRMIMQEIAFLRSMFDNDCAVDIHLHWGQCTDPTQFNQYVAAWILRDVFATNWSTDTTIAFQSSDRAPVNEAIDISAGDFFQVMATLKYAARAPELVDVEPLISISVCGNKACAGDACPPSNGCDKLYAIGAVDNTVYVSIDGGDNWDTSIGPTLAADYVAVACMGDRVAVVAADGSVGIAPRDLIDDFSGSSSSDWTVFDQAINGEVPTAAIGVSTVLGSVVIVGTQSGKIYSFDQNSVVTELDNGGASGGDPINGFGSNGQVVLAVTSTGKVLVSRGSGWSATLQAPTSIALFAAAVKTSNHWLVGGEDGELWCTENGGCNWVQVPIVGLSTDQDITDLCVSNDHVLWMAADGKIWRSIDGGSSWVLEPNDSTPGCRAAVASLGTIARIACCSYNPNLVIGIGTTLGVDPDPDGGLILIGEP